MKVKLLYLFFLFAFSMSYAQTFPINDIQGYYKFDSGAVLVDQVGVANLTQNGALATGATDRFNSSNGDAIQLNGDDFSRANIPTTRSVTHAFWVKTSTNNNNNETIIGDSDRPGAGFNSTTYGYDIHLRNGGIILYTRIKEERNNGAFNDIARALTSSVIADDTWHHVAVVFYTNGTIDRYLNTKIYIDGVLDASDTYDTTRAVRTFPFNSGTLAIGNNRVGNLSSVNKYKDYFDDYFVYSRVLDASEILTLATQDGYCLVPQNNIISATGITENSATINVSLNSNTYDIAYGLKSESLANATILSNVNSTVNIASLQASTDYNVYIREQCASGLTSNWSNPISFRTLGPIYVDDTATGLNDGSSWQNAFTSLMSALDIDSDGQEIWVAGGTYKTQSSGINVRFNIDKPNVSLYGGFAGTETLLSQRVLGANESIISGDTNGDDAAGVLYDIDATRSDNTRGLIDLTTISDGFTIDGFTITAGMATYSKDGGGINNVGANNVMVSNCKFFRNGGHRNGGAIFNLGDMTIESCVFEENFSLSGGAVYQYLAGGNPGTVTISKSTFLNNKATSTGGAVSSLLFSSTGTSLNIDASEFVGNNSRSGGGIYVGVPANSTFNVSITNTLFNGNIVEDNASSVGNSGSAAWLRTTGTNSTLTTSIVNNTFVNNIDTGTATGLNNFTRATLALTKNNAAATHNASVSNNIFYNNRGASSSTVSKSITGLTETMATVTVENSIDENSFSSIAAGSKTNTSNADPLFTSSSDFTLSAASSPAANTGNNSAVTTILDLLGNHRIFNTTVDMGAYEFGSSAPIYRTLTINATNGTVATDPNPTNGTYTDGQVVELTATPDTGYQFDNWSGDASGVLNPLNITMDANKTVTANFSLIPAPTPTFITPPTSISGAFTATIQFDIAVTGFDVSDIQVTGASLSNFTAVSGTEYTVLVTPTSICASSVTLKVPENVAQNSSNVNNVASSLITIASVDNVAPIVITQDITVQLDANGNAAFTPSQIDNGSSDNCAIASRNLDVSNFTCSNIGTNTVRLTVEDTTGNSANNTATVTVVDNIAPIVVTQNVTITLDVNGNTSITAAAINNGSSDNCSISTYTLSKTAFTCSDLGANNVVLTVTDVNGNSDTATAVVTVSQNPNQTFTARAQNITVQLDASGNVTITPQQVDNGSGSGCNNNPTLSLDKTAFTCADLGNNAVTLTATDGSTTDTAQAIVTVEDNVVPVVLTQNVTIQLDANGNASITTADINNGSSDNCGIKGISLDKSNFTCSDIGANNVTLTVVDSSANSADNTATVTVVDNIAPIVVTQNVTITLDVNGNASTTAAAINNGSTDNCGIASMSLDTAAFTCSDLGANNVVLTVTDVNGNSETATAVVTVSQSPNQTFTARAQNITVQLDVSGNVTITPQQVDNGSGSGCNNNPTLSLDKTDFTCADLGNNAVTLTATDGSTTDTAQATVTVEDNVVPVVLTQNVTIQLDANGNASILPTQVNNGSTDNCGIEGISLDKSNFTCSDIGANIVTLTVVDSSANSADNTATVTVVDNVAPTVVTQNVTIQLDVNGNASTTAAAINNGSTDNCGIASMSLDTTTFTCSDLGANNVVLTVTDVNGNSDTATAVVTVDPNPNQTFTARTQNITVQLDANGNVTITPQQVDNGSGSGCNNNPTLSLDKTAFTCADLGNNAVTLTATDGSTTDTVQAIVTVEDNVAPVVLTQNVTIQLDANGNASITTADINNGSSDNCGIEGISLDKSNFTCSDIGVNTVTLTVVDSSANSAGNTAIVTVEDNVAPVVLTQNVTIQLDVNGNASTTAAAINNGSSDNCSISTYTLSKTVFTCSDLGANNVVLTVTDVNGNSDTATAVVTVSQNPNQTFTARTQNITVQLDASGNVTITPQQVDNGSGSGCNNNPTLSLDKTAFTCADLGNNAVTLTATDGSTTDTAQAIVTVEDNVVPVVLTQNITIQLDANGNASITTADINNGSSDNCGIEGISLDKSNFTCSDIGVNTVTLTVVDSSANSADNTATVTVVDNVAPTVVTQNVTITLDVNGNASTTAAAINNGSTDNCGIASMSLDTTAFTCSDLGANNVVLTVTDVNGNSDTATAVVTVDPNPNQTLTVIAQNITVQLDASGNVTITPQQVDNGSGSGCNSNPTLSLDVTDFTCANIGTNTVTLTATEGQTTDTAQATVTVEDNVAPVVLTQNVTIQLDANGNASIVVADIDNGSSDNCGIDSRSLDITDFTCSDIGANNVTLTVEDVNGNISTNTAIVTVSESVAPTVVTQDITVALDANGSVSITTGDIDNGSSDGCSGIASMSLDQSTFDCPTLGDVTVTLTVTDTSGNSATGTAIVTITGPDEDNDGISDACDSKEIVFNKGFSPNGDNQNDTWVIENIDNYPKNTVEIFNRWGERVYKASDYKNDFDGKANQRGGSSDKLPVGSYLYIINLNEPGFTPIKGWLYINY
ncbi:T9SS type B sorting domain-containing protein [Tenacibaculum retecalamus]|uniref:T9SS type B sorting domain-containing protein n=1 Tax=Tenacibaculum retecalamus TaxID=3018315 RepID=UPI0023D90A87|nr:gliding motility-associated C-terminal domain-containing protein [Tenacibaculum retecalamus]WBX72418.1 gliding motility-associated C-terminal domain-containing protein [Tenacibaculum retecalamus]